MKLDARTVFIIVVLIIGIGITLNGCNNGYKIDKVIDGTTIQLNNGTTVKLIGITTTEESKVELERLLGEKVELQPDGSANFDPNLFNGHEVVYSYVLLPDNSYEHINATLLKRGLSDLNEDGCLIDSLTKFRMYAETGKNVQRRDNINPTPIVQVIDYQADSLELPKYTPQPERRINSWSSNKEDNIEMLSTACDYNLPYTKMFANQLAGRAQGVFCIEQVCEIFDYCYTKWRYVNDPNGQDYIASASETIAASLTGDCDDFAVLIASCILACGGDACIVYADGPSGCHAYPEVDINSFKSNTDVSYIQEVITQRFASYSPGYPSIREHNGHRWLNLDWQAAYPGGKYFPANIMVHYTAVDGKWSTN